MSEQRIADLERQLMTMQAELAELRKASQRVAVPDYTFVTLDGEVRLSDLFGGRDKLLMIHNMGEGCRYCTLWADGFNGFLPHLESAMAVVLTSGDDPQTQRRFAASRGWRFRLASHAGSAYLPDQTVMPGADNMPGAVVYESEGRKIYRKNACVFGPGDLYCSMWSLLGLAGLGEAEWTPQYNYWQRPEVLLDGGENLLG